MNKKDIDYSDLSRVGRRPSNEDKALCAVRGSRDTDNRVVLAVADGMGGLEAGEVASKTVYDELLKLYGEGLPGDLSQISKKVESCIKTANRGIYDWSQKNVGARVGTTVSGALIIGDRYLAFNVGDSRTYIINAKGIKQLTNDHSSDWDEYLAGHLKKEDIGRGVYPNAVKRAIGTEQDVIVDIFQSESSVLKEGDILFSCTDGLWGRVTNEDIWRLIFGTASIQKSLEALYKLAYNNGSKDNISMAAYRYGGIDALPGLDIKDKKKTSVAPPSGEKASEQKEPGEAKKESKILKPLLIASIAGFLLVVVILIVASIIPVKEFNSQGNDSKNIQEIGPTGTERSADSSGDKQGETRDGDIKFSPSGGIFGNQVEVQLNSNPLKSDKGDVIDSDLYYTLDGNVPTKMKGTKYTIGKPVVFPKNGTYTLKARLLSIVGKYEGPVCYEIYTIKPPNIVVGGKISFTKIGEESSGAIQVQMDFESLRFSNGNVIDSEIYYTFDGSDPKSGNGTKYRTGEKLAISSATKDVLKARVISRDGEHMGRVYPQTYAFQSKQLIPIVSLSELDIEAQAAINGIEPFNINAQDIEKINIQDYTPVIIKFSIDKSGNVKVVNIENLNSDLKSKLSEFKSNIGATIQMKLGNLKPTKNKEPVDTSIELKFSVSKGLSGDKIIFIRISQ